MRVAATVVAMLVFFSASAAEKKTNARAFRMPEKKAEPKAVQPKPAGEKAAEAKPAEPTQGADVPPVASRASSQPPAGAFRFPETKEPQSRAAAPAETPPVAVAEPAQESQNRAFTLPNHKRAVTKKRNPAAFRLPEKKN